MAFAASLAKTTLEVKEAARKKEEELKRQRLEKAMDLAMATLEKIKAKCQAAAKAGKDQTTFREDTVCCERDLGPLADQRLKPALQKAGLEVLAYAWCWGTSTWPLTFSVSGTVSWAKAVKEAEGKAPPPKRQKTGNFRTTCGICQEERTAVCLTPCGHLICEHCGAKNKEKCPFCRSNVLEVQQIFKP